MKVTNEAIFGVLQSIQADVVPLRESVVKLTAQVSKIREYMLSTQLDIAKIYEKLAAHELRIALLERHNEVLAEGVA
jgi:hypothetical protein